MPVWWQAIPELQESDSFRITESTKRSLNGKAKPSLNFCNNLGHIPSGPSDLVTVSLASLSRMFYSVTWACHRVHTEQKGDYFLHLEQWTHLKKKGKKEKFAASDLFLLIIATVSYNYAKDRLVAWTNDRVMFCLTHTHTLYI